MNFMKITWKTREDRLIQEKIRYMDKFPLLIFPEHIQNVINELVRKNNATQEFLACSILSAVSTAIGTTRKVRIKNGIENFCTLFICLVGKPGTAKSPAINFAFKPIKKIDRINSRAYRDYLAEYESALEIRKKDKKISVPEKPKLKKILYSDYTIESFVENHANNPRGVCVAYDELAGWFKNFGRYNASSEQETWLSVWSGESVNVLRKGSGDTHIEEPFANVIGGIQPGVMSVITNDGRGSNGFLSRFLFCFPHTQKKKTIPRTEIDFKEIEKTYSDFINSFFELEHTYNEYDDLTPMILDLSEDAKDIFFVKNQQITDDINEEGHDAMRDFRDKTFHYFVRFALIIELMKDRNATEISGESMHLAEHLFDYFYSKINKVFEYINNQPVKQDRFFAVYNELDNTQYARKVLIEKFSSLVNMSTKSIDRRLNDKNLFTKDIHGYYTKINKNNEKND